MSDRVSRSVSRVQASWFLGLACSLTFVIGCAGSKKSGGEPKNNTVYRDAAAQRASFDLGCGAESITTQVIGGGGNSPLATIGVTGCGHKASYVCQCDGGANIFGALTCSRAVCAMDATSAPEAAPAAETAPQAAPPAEVELPPQDR